MNDISCLVRTFPHVALPALNYRPGTERYTPRVD